MAFWFGASAGLAQSGLQRLDEHIPEGPAAGRADGQTRVWRMVADANNYVNARIPIGVLVDGFIRNDGTARRNGLYMTVRPFLTAPPVGACLPAG